MKILYFHQHFSTPTGATGTRSYEFARSLIAHGHDVTMICGTAAMGETGLQGMPVNGFRTGVVDGINIIEVCLPYSNYDSLFKRAIIFLRYSLSSVKIVISNDFDLLFATSTPLTAGISGVIAKIFKPRKKFIFEVRDLWPELPKAMGVITNPLILFGMSVLEKLSYIAMDGGVALSPGIKEGMQRRSKKGKRIELIPNGCDLNLFKFSEDRPQKKILNQKNNGINRDDFVAVFTGAHGVANGLEAVLDTAIVLKKRSRNDIKLVFIGDGKLKQQLVGRATVEHLDNCIFIDPMPKIELAEIMNEVDAGLMILANIPAFYYGTSPNKFFDYISIGLPVLNNYPGWLADMISENACGIPVKPHDPNEFADALMTLADNDVIRQHMKINARRLAEKEFDRNDLANRFVRYLESFTI